MSENTSDVVVVRPRARMVDKESPHLWCGKGSPTRRRARGVAQNARACAEGEGGPEDHAGGAHGGLQHCARCARAPQRSRAAVAGHLPHDHGGHGRRAQPAGCGGGAGGLDRSGLPRVAALGYRHATGHGLRRRARRRAIAPVDCRITPQPGEATTHLAALAAAVDLDAVFQGRPMERLAHHKDLLRDVARLALADGAPTQAARGAQNNRAAMRRELPAPGRCGEGTLASCACADSWRHGPARTRTCVARASGASRRSGS